MGFAEDSNTTDQFDNEVVVLADKDDPSKKAKVDTFGSVFSILKDISGSSITSSTIGTSLSLDSAISGSLSVISTSNSSTTPLSANATFTGGWEEVTKYGSVSIILDTDKDSANDGIEIQLSSDGINVDVIHQYTRDASATPFGGAGMLPIKSKYFRFVYNNGNQAQSYFRLQTIFHVFYSNPINLIATPITDSSASVTSRSVITGKTAQGNYVNVKVTPSGSLTTAIGDISGIVGQNTMANSIPVVIASNQSDVGVKQATAANLNAQVVGNAAAGTADSGNPVKIGGIFNSVLPTLTNGQRGNLQLDSSSRVIISPLTNSSVVKAQLQDNSGNSLNSTNNQLQTRDVINVSSQYKALSVTTSATEAIGGSSRLTNRKVLSITPTNGTVYYGTSNSVTTATGTPIFKNQTVSFSFTDNVPVYIISAGTVDVRILEGS